MLAKTKTADIHETHKSCVQIKALLFGIKIRVPVPHCCCCFNFHVKNWGEKLLIDFEYEIYTDTNSSNCSAMKKNKMKPFRSERFLISFIHLM